MRIRAYFSVLVGLAVLLPYPGVLGRQAPRTPPPDREAILAVVEELDAAWNARDAARFSAVFSEDGSFGFPFEGTALRGREEIRKHYVKLFPTLPPGLRHVTTIGDFEILDPSLVAVDFEVDIMSADPRAGTGPAPIVHYHGFGLGVRTGSGWGIRSARVYALVKQGA